MKSQLLASGAFERRGAFLRRANKAITVAMTTVLVASFGQPVEATLIESRSSAVALSSGAVLGTERDGEQIFSSSEVRASTSASARGQFRLGRFATADASSSVDLALGRLTALASVSGSEQFNSANAISMFSETVVFDLGGRDKITIPFVATATAIASGPGLEINSHVMDFSLRVDDRRRSPVQGNAFREETRANINMDGIIKQVIDGFIDVTELNNIFSFAMHLAVSVNGSGQCGPSQCDTLSPATIDASNSADFRFLLPEGVGFTSDSAAFLSAQRIPEPPTLVLLFAAVFGLALVRSSAWKEALARLGARGDPGPRPFLSFPALDRNSSDDANAG